MGNKDVKAKSMKGKATKKGGIVNLPDNSDHSDLEDVQEVDQENSQEKQKTALENTNGPVQKQIQKQTQREEADEEGDDELPDIEPCKKRRKVTVALTEEQEEGLLEWFNTMSFSIIKV